FRRFEFAVDIEELERTAIWGPFRRRRACRRSDILGVSLRESKNTQIGNSYSRLWLVLNSGRSVPLMPIRPTAYVAPLAAALAPLLNRAAQQSAIAPPIGGGLTATETPQALRIPADP